jgi:hydrogenase maturation protease
VVAGFGSPDRHDDGVGPVVAARAAVECSLASDVGPLGDPLDLLGLWNGAALTVVVDAVSSGAAPGTVRVFELTLDDRGADDAGSEGGVGVTSTHGLGLAAVWRLARAVGQAPQRVVVVGVEGERFDFGPGLSPAVQAAIPDATRRVVELIKEVSSCA